MLLASIERLRALPRLLEVTRTLLGFGMHDLVRSVGVHRLLGEAGDVLGWAPAADVLARPLPDRARLALEALGPAFVKLGQVLASRVDMLPPEWTASLDKLHDRATPVDFAALAPQLAADLGRAPEEAFARFERAPRAAGSIAQVHRAELPGGRAVAVKIRRPGVEGAIEADVRLLEALAAWWEEEDPAARRWQPAEVVRQLRRSLAREVDFAAEARAQARFAESFAGDPGIVVPRVHDAYTRASLLVMDWIEGVPGTDMAALDAAGLDRATLAARGADAVLRMVLAEGFFHADPHPGNVFFLAGNRIAFIDFGMVGWISGRRREELVDLLAGLAERDPYAMRDVLLAWCEGARVQGEAFADDLGRLLHLYEHAELADIRLDTLLSEIAAIMREQGLRLPPDLALLFKALITLEGLGTRLMPSFRLIEHVTPYVERLVAERWTAGRVAGRASAAARSSGRLLRTVPRLLDSLARRLDDDGMAVRLEMREVEVFSRHLEASVNRLAVGLVTAALIVGSAILVSAANAQSSLTAWLLGAIGVAIAFANSVWLILAIRRSRRRE